MKILIISGSPRKNSHSKVLANIAQNYLINKSAKWELIDLSEISVENFKGFEETYNENTKKAVHKLKESDVIIISTPVYNNSFSGAVKNIFEHSNYKELKGKVASFIINSGRQASFNSTHFQLNALMNYFDIFSNPKAVYAFSDDFEGLKLINETIKERIIDLCDSSIELGKKLT